MAEIGINSVEAGGVCNRYIYVICPGHRFRHDDLLFLRRIHITLATDDQLGTFHRKVALNFRIVPVIISLMVPPSLVFTHEEKQFLCQHFLLEEIACQKY
jgi:hypothetical protein